MKIVIQRVKNANVKVDGKTISKIQKGYLVLVGFEEKDNKEMLDKVARKIINLRIFEDENGKTNLDIKKVNGEILCISQFTLCADLSSGNRPSFICAAKPEKAQMLYNEFLAVLNKEIVCKGGVFGADMKVELLNDGPFTICLEY